MESRIEFLMPPAAVPGLPQERAENSNLAPRKWFDMCTGRGAVWAAVLDSSGTAAATGLTVQQHAAIRRPSVAVTTLAAI